MSRTVKRILTIVTLVSALAHTQLTAPLEGRYIRASDLITSLAGKGVLEDTRYGSSTAAAGRDM